MTPAYVVKLGLTTQKTSVEVQKIDGSKLEVYDMVLASFLLQDRLERVWFFKKIYLLADTSIEVILEMSFLALSNTHFWFDIKKRT